MRRILRQLWLFFLGRRTKVGQVQRVAVMREVPDKLGGDVYIVGGTKPKWVVLECPCRCGERIDVNLMPTARRHWQITELEQRLTLWPSLFVSTRKCGSHFWITRGRFRWIRAG